LKGELARLAPEDRMSLVAYDGRQLVQLAAWTGSAAELSAAFDKAMERKAYGIARKAELASFESSSRLGGGDFEQLLYARQLNDRLDRAVKAAVSTLRAAASAPGRKVMLLLAGGWPYSPAAYAANRPGPSFDSRLPREGEVFVPLADTANRLGFTIYPVDVPGFEGTGPDASSQGSTLGAWEVREDEIHSALTFIAARTGGLAMINAARVNALGRAQADTRSYYWLGFSPTWRQDDKRHDIVVKVGKPGLAVRSRQSVLDLSRQAEVTMMVENALLFGGRGSAAMPMALGKAERSGVREIEVPVTLTIPLSSVTIIPLAGKYAAELTLRFAALDERGDRSDIPAIPLKWTFDTPPPKGGGTIRYDTRLKLRRIDQQVIAALFDPLSGKITTAQGKVAP
jgi:VWFA-related protein